MNRNSNVYTVIYATILTVLVAVLLSLAALSLKDKQKANTDNEKKQQILMAVSEVLGKDVTFENAAEIWNELDMDNNTLVTTPAGEVIVDGVAFEITPKAQFKAGEVKPEAELPVYVANINGTPYYIMCMYGAGLWDAIWGYVAVDAEGVIKGCSFDHAGETAGLGAKIKDDPNFAKAFIGKNIYAAGELASVDVNKPGKANRFVAGGEHVDCITGATKTSDCVAVMMYNSLKGYEGFLRSLNEEVTVENEVEACCAQCADSCACDSCACPASECEAQ